MIALALTLNTSQGQGAESIWSSPRGKETGKLGGYRNDNVVLNED
jgi:hypothetical protein